MAIGRYENDETIRSGQILQSATAVLNIRRAIQAGQLTLKTRTLKESQRLDVIAGQEYGDGRLWWIIAAASNVGWALQCPAGTRVVIPNLNDVTSVI